MAKMDNTVKGSEADLQHLFGESALYLYADFQRVLTKSRLVTSNPKYIIDLFDRRARKHHAMRHIWEPFPEERNRIDKLLEHTTSDDRQPTMTKPIQRLQEYSIQATRVIPA